MSKDTKVLLAVFVIGMVALGAFTYALHVRFLGLTMQLASVKPTPSATAEPTVEPSASPEETSPSPKGKATATPKATPSASANSEE